MKIKKASIVLTILVSLGILATSVLYKKTTKNTQEQHSINPEIPSLLVEKLLIRHLLGSPEATIEATLASNEKPEEDPYHFHCQGDIFTWKDVGTLPNGNQIVYAYYWPDGAMGKFSGLYVVKYDKDKETLHFVTEIAWGERHSSGVAETGWQLDGNTLTYSQHMSCYGFFDYMLDNYPNLFELAQDKSREGLCYGEAGYLGYADFQVTVNPDGTLGNKKLIAFNGAIAGLEQLQEVPALNSLSMMDALVYVFMKFNAKNEPSELATIEEQYLEQLIKEALRYTKNESNLCENLYEGQL